MLVVPTKQAVEAKLLFRFQNPLLRLLQVIVMGLLFRFLPSSIFFSEAVNINETRGMSQYVTKNIEWMCQNIRGL